MYDVDLFDAPEAVLDTLHADGRVIICYFSAGSHEEWRDDAALYPEAALGNPLDGWEGERWVDIRDTTVRDILAARMDHAVTRQCDGVEPDNVDGYANDSGFPLSADDQLDFNTWLATEAHARGLSVGLKNDLDQVEALEPSFDWALNEECISWDECGMLDPFIEAGYVDDPGDGPAAQDEVCPPLADSGFSTLIKTWDLDAWVLTCDP
jgi:hypothetical protein